MIGASISRWTITYFAVALTWLFAALILMVAGVGYPASEIASPDTLVLVHVVCIGWLSLALCGALFQFVPVLVAKPLFSDRMPLPALALLNIGLLALLAGFLSLGGRLPPALWLLPLGAVSLAAGFGLVLVDLGMTAWQRRTGPSRFVLVGLASLFATTCFGVLFAFTLAGKAGPMGELAVIHGIPLHAIAGLGGWLTLTAMGVSYRLLPMFMLSPDVDDRQSRITFLAGTCTVVVAVVGGSIAIGAESGLSVVLSIAALLGAATVVSYGWDVAGVFRMRKRRQLELSMRMSTLSFASLAGTIVLGGAIVVADAIADHIGSFVFLACFGWLSGLVLAKLYKIVAFLTWIETYGPVLGRAPTPRVQDLVAESRATKWFVIYYASVWAGTAALLTGQPMAFRLCLALISLGIVGIVHEMIRTRRLADVAQPLRLPGGASIPPLLFARN